MRVVSTARFTHAQPSSFSVGSSVFAIAMGISSPAAAQCAPDPATPNGTTNCEGLDSDGLNVATSGTRVVVGAGALVLPGAEAAAIVTGGADNRISVAGDVAGGAQSGVLVTNAGTTSTFEVGGVPLSRDAASLGLDVVWSPVDNIRIVSGYNGRIGGQSEDSSFRLMASIGF